jgi:hypothetical protein
VWVDDMANIYDRLSQTATRLIKKYGYNKAKYYRQVKTEESWNNEFETKTVLVDIIVLPSPKYSRETFRLQGERAMVDNNYIAYMPHSNFVPTINDTFTVKGVTYSIQSVVRINPNGKDVLYKLELK